MPIKQNNSRLAETSYSNFNLRDAYVNDAVVYQSILRDEAIFSNYGVKALIRVPIDDFDNIIDNNVDEYSNFVDIRWLDTTESVVPKFTEYRQTLSEAGMTADGTDGIYPLEVLIPSTLHLPRNSRMILNEYNDRGEKISREWVVLGTIQKQLSNGKAYSRIANCVPARQSEFNTSMPSTGTIWFDYKVGTYTVLENLRAQGIIWFLRSGVNVDKVNKIYRDEIQEQVPEYPVYDEQVLVLMYYDDRSKHILDGGKNFKVGEIYTVYDIYDQPVQVIDDLEEETTIDLKITVTCVDEIGRITEFKYNTNKGYTEFEDNMQVFVGDKNKQATIELVNTTWTDDLYQETIEAPEILKPKYITPYRMDARFTVKTLAISVLS